MSALVKFVCLIPQHTYSHPKAKFCHVCSKVLCIPITDSNVNTSCWSFSSVQTSAYLLTVPRLQHFHHDTSKRDEVCSGICHTWRTVGLLVYHCLFICVSSFLSLGWHQCL